MASLDDFLLTGRLGPVSTGQSEHEVVAQLGSPEDSSEGTFPRILKYGALQLAFYKLPNGSELCLVSITVAFHTPEEGLPEALALSGWMPDGNTIFDEFREHISEVGIPVVGGVETGPSQSLVLGAGVRVTFDEGRLYSVGFTAKRETKVKQLTVSIPKEELEAIRKEAVSRGISVSALCSSWIEERVASLEHR
jgi:hypothetical protein